MNKILILLLAIRVTVTAYSSTPDQTAGDPLITASGKRVRPGIVAVSRDLLKHLPWGTRIVLEGIGIFVVEDKMAKRWTRRVDIWMSSRAKAKQFGIRRTILKEKRRYYED